MPPSGTWLLRGHCQTVQTVTDEQQREPSVDVIVQVTQVLEALPVQRLRLINDDQTELRRQRPFERPISLEGQ